MRMANIDSSDDEKQVAEPVAETTVLSEDNEDERGKPDPQKELSDFSDLVLNFINSSSAVGENGLQECQ